MSAYHNCFDVSIQCEEFLTVTPEEQDEVFALIAQENEAKRDFFLWLDSLEETERQAYLEQQALERSESERKKWMEGYTNAQDGSFYGGIAI